MTSLFNRSSKLELFVSQLDDTICVEDILDPQLPDPEHRVQSQRSDFIFVLLSIIVVEFI